MSWDFKSAKELLKLCGDEGLPISEVMLRRELELGKSRRSVVLERVDERLRIMDAAIGKAVLEPGPSMGGLIGGEARKLRDLDREKTVCGPLMHDAMINALAVAETNAGMGLIVAAPTAGSAGVLPAVLMSLYRNHDLDMDKLRVGMINASAIGYIITRNGSVSGAEAGCQAEVGSAAAMAASAVVEMLGGSPEQCCDAASLALSNLLGLVCDPVGGLVELPCQTRNVMGAACAFTSAELALAGVGIKVPLDEMIGITLEVGRTLPDSLRETAMGGCASAPSLCGLCVNGSSKRKSS